MELRTRAPGYSQGSKLSNTEAKAQIAHDCNGSRNSVEVTLTQDMLQTCMQNVYTDLCIVYSGVRSMYTLAKAGHLCFTCTIHDKPTSNAFPLNIELKRQWKSFHRAVTEIIERFAFVQDFPEAGKEAHAGL